MLFNSYVFIFAFLPITLTGYYVIRFFCSDRRPSLIWLTFCSLFFYGYFNWAYLLILVCSILLNWLFVSCMRHTKERYRRLLEIIGIIFNVGLIFYFKYYDFFIMNVNALFKAEFNLKNIVLPLGISFFTFQQISFVVDSYRHETDSYNFIEYASFVSFFPQLIAGPIVLHNELIPQFKDDSKRVISWDGFARGCFMFSVGLFKKVMIADTFGRAVTWGYSYTDLLSTPDAIIVILSYSFQIYFDFSGYCDMASGIAALFNIDLPINFDSPYKASSIIDFWKSWHMTLTRFLRKYVYFPLGGSKKGKIRTYLNIMIVFIVSGIWHGANWTFILWGVIHGIAQCLNRMFKNRWNKLHSAFQWICTFSFVSFAWVFFRAENIPQAIKIIWRSVNFRKMTISSELIKCFDIVEIKGLRWALDSTKIWTDFYKSYWINGFVMLLWLFGAFYIVLNKENVQIKRPTYSVARAIGTAILLVWGIISLSGVSTFLYFNF